MTGVEAAFAVNGSLGLAKASGLPRGTGVVLVSEVARWDEPGSFSRGVGLGLAFFAVALGLEAGLLAGLRLGVGLGALTANAAVRARTTRRREGVFTAGILSLGLKGRCRERD